MGQHSVDVLERLKALFNKPQPKKAAPISRPVKKAASREDSVLDRALANTMRSLDREARR